MPHRTPYNSSFRAGFMSPSRHTVSKPVHYTSSGKSIAYFPEEFANKLLSPRRSSPSMHSPSRYHHSLSSKSSHSTSPRMRDSHGRFVSSHSNRSSPARSLHKPIKRSAQKEKMVLFINDVKTHRPHIYLKIDSDPLAWRKDPMLRQMFHERFPEYKGISM